jgi:drug/metabolite transporter (DMT)-like permease
MASSSRSWRECLERVQHNAWALAVCTLFLVVGPSLMLVNKNVMDKQGVDFPYPFLVSSMGLVFTSFVTHALHLAGMLELPHAHLVTQGFFLRAVLPVGACHAATLAFGNAQYLFMGMALIQFLKAFTPMVVTLFTLVLLKKRQSSQVWLALVVTCFGTSLTAVGDMKLNLLGLVLAACSSSTEAVRLVLTQYALQDCRFTLLESQYFLAPAGAVCLLLVSWFFEREKLLASGDLAKLHDNPGTFLVCGSLGFGVQMLTSSVIKLTSSTTVKVLSQLRNALVVLSGVLLYGEVVSPLQLVGYVVSVIGITRYTALQSEAGQGKDQGPAYSRIPSAAEGSPDKA